MITTRRATVTDIAAIENVLRAWQLPAQDITGQRVEFFVAEKNGDVVGVGGLENCGNGMGLVRSFAVNVESQRRGIAKMLFTQAIAHAKSLGVTELYLLTTNTQRYFSKFGFVAIDRLVAPEAIQRTSQFSMLCPSTATLMYCPIAAIE